MAIYTGYYSSIIIEGILDLIAGQLQRNLKIFLSIQFIFTNKIAENEAAMQTCYLANMCCAHVG